MLSNRNPELKARTRPMARATFLLYAALIVAALLIGYISYRYSFSMMEKGYQSFYLNKAEMIVKAADLHTSAGDAGYLKSLENYWKAAGHKPQDEYICVVDAKGNLLLHTANPGSVGNYAGDNPVLGGAQSGHKNLCDLVNAQTNYAGKYVSSAGQDQVAAFFAIPSRKWMLGVHRSRSALYAEIESGYRPLLIGFLAICGLLMPVFLYLLFITYRTAQKKQIKYEMALRESEQRYQSLVDTMPQGMFRTDLKGKLTFANNAFLDDMGLSLAGCLGKPVRDLLPPDLAADYASDEVGVIRSGETLDVVHRFRMPGGQEDRYAEIVHHPVRDGEGAIVGVQSLLWDVTDKRQAEENLKHTKAQLETVLQSVPSGIFAVDQDCRFTIVNQQAEKLMGFHQADALGKPANQFVPDTRLDRVLASGKLEMGKPFSHNGRNFMVSRSPILQRDQVIGAVSVFQDASELEAVQKQVEELQRLNDELSSLIENSHDGVLITDTYQVITVNPSFGRITGLAPSMLKGRDVSGLDSERHVCLAVVQAVFRHVKSHRSSVTMRRKLNSGNEIFVTGNPVLDKYGQVVRVVMNIRDVTELHSLEEHIKRLSEVCLEDEKAAASPEAAFGIVAESPATKNLLDLAMRVAQVDSTVLLSGESGVGKDVLAKLIHNLSKRSGQPFVSLNCGAIPEHLLESELFGYEKGAFSGADRYGKPGLFEEAVGGTVFLDEVGELPLNLQVKPLKVLQEQRCRRLGSVKTVDLDIRILAATNRNLKQMVADGQFREDLFYRLYVVPIEIPPLRERRQDILPLALRFLKAYNKKYDVSRSLGHELLRVLETAEWPGNVRELQNVIERLVVTADADVLEPRHLPRSMHPGDEERQPPLVWVTGDVKLREARDQLEKQLIQKALSQTNNTREAAKLLGVTHSTVVRKAQKYGLALDGNSTIH
ncbi:MAG: sigma 54-interacting transcriptional regulator [Desulfarculaceae bacterium]|nr:sigma 54-interacting transcriptional regulator [Desulfarculaceae bacterium]MCF8073214.1 sigma 54-interacting transcriptional regulator [Desulfarculaceae bacterium]MCF8100810.1 sigma 54-interacting transcriptional regulator [Desulfarculaceae bacterium]MCF8117752.1 sigma 54-interacting transcriptional regulator [Desulfarculaceae bacterium]